ncbi:putative hemin transport protein [Catalinimonas alkaloidigena]|uniref:Putative hemin transport protein n=1 Tax=Catalinimonas alkaloidigena TaxID=1075417 RepID=A0A1G9KDW7_9BACT|nr:ChuX/HutX family heme-like substrate-binding protein [Catalinimonas alkaloidigena]SDL47782.1 putative hemin transport protein [Catalinimonas alkaloidigena]
MKHTSALPDTPMALRQAWDDLKAQEPRLRIRDCAAQLGVSEAELLATTVGETAVRLQGDWPQLVKRLPDLGRVMSLTRNASCVLEHKGPFQKVDTFGEGDRAMGTVIGPIETRVFFKAWHVGFAVRLETPHGLQQSLQIFDREGTAVTKIYLQPESHQAVYDQLVADYRAEDQSNAQPTTPYAPETYATDVDREALLQDWAQLEDTHHFFGMLRKHQVHRLDALHLAEGRFAHRIAPEALASLLETAASTQLPIMIFAGNRGNLQIHQGKVRTIRVMGPWLNVLDPTFNMHLRQDHIDTAWIVEKPTTDGTVTALELYDPHKNLIAQLFGLRKPGVPEKSAWRALVAELPRL